MAEDFRIAGWSAKPNAGASGILCSVQHGKEGVVEVDIQNWTPRNSSMRYEMTTVGARDPDRPGIVSEDMITPPLDLGPSEEARERVGAVALAAARALVLKQQALGLRA